MKNIRNMYKGVSFNGSEDTKRLIINFFAEAADDYIREGIGSNVGKAWFYLYLDGSLGKALDVVGESVHDEQLQHFGETTLYLPGALVEEMHELLRGLRLSGMSLRLRHILMHGFLSAIPVGLTTNEVIPHANTALGTILSTLALVRHYQDDLMANRRIRDDLSAEA